MTLLVVNIELPEGFEPKSNQEFLTRLWGLSDTFIAYLITFFVLVSFWFGCAKETGEPEMASAAYAWAVLLHLLSVTFLPFSMLAVGRYDVPAAVWIYGANMILLSLSAIAISLIAERDSGRARVPSGRVELAILIASAVLSMVSAGLRYASLSSQSCLSTRGPRCLSTVVRNLGRFHFRCDLAPRRPSFASCFCLIWVRRGPDHPSATYTAAPSVRNLALMLGMPLGRRLLTREAMIPSRVGPVRQVQEPVDRPDATAERPSWGLRRLLPCDSRRTTAHQARSSQ